MYFVSDDVYKEEELDVSVIWHLVLATSVFRADGLHLLKYKDKLMRLLRLIMPLSCKNASDVSVCSTQCERFARLENFTDLFCFKNCR